jgi:hypothetical protein
LLQQPSLNQSTHFTTTPAAHFAPPAFSPGWAFIAACSLLAFPTKPQHVVPILLIAVVVGAVFGGGAYVAITALRAAWDTAIARVRGHR